MSFLENKIVYGILYTAITIACFGILALAISPTFFGLLTPKPQYRGCTEVVPPYVMNFCVP
jgi:hypothetical protein